MGKFISPKVREHTFSSLEEMICDICDEFKDIKNDVSIGICLTKEEVPKILVALLSTGKFTPMWLEYEGGDDYYLEYHLTVESNGDLYLSKSWNEDHEKYYNCLTELDTITFVSQDISKELYDILEKEHSELILFEIEE